MVQLKVGPTSRKGLHRDACVLDAAHICLVCVSNHHFVPGLLEVVSDLTDVQEIIEELFGEFAGDTCVLFGCCPNFTPKPLSMYQWASKALCCYGCMFWNLIGIPLRSSRVLLFFLGSATHLLW